MSCAVDPALWGKANRVRLFPEKVNQWVLGRTLVDSPTRQSVEDTTMAVLRRWFGDSGIGFLTGEASDAVDAIQIVDVAYERPIPRASDERRETLDPVPTLAPSPGGYLYVTVRFNYRGLERDMPWPVWTAPRPFEPSFTLAARRCPFGADWMLEQATTPRPGEPLEPVPEEKTIWEKLSRYTPSLAAPIATADVIVRVLGVGIAVYAAIQLYAIAQPLVTSTTTASRRIAAGSASRRRKKASS